MARNSNDRTVSTSKIITFISCVIFLFCLFVGFGAMKNNVYDTTFYVTTVTVSGGICATAFLSYYKKAQAENIVKLRSEIYRSAAKERINFNREMLELKNQYNLTPEDFDELDRYSEMDDFMDTASMELGAAIDESISDSTSLISHQSF